MGPVNPTAIVFDAPTEFVDDNSPIPAGTITKYQYAFGQSPTALNLIRDDIDLTPNADGKQTSPLSVAGSLAIGQWYVAGRSVTKDGAVAKWSTAAAFEIRAKEPKPIAVFGVT